MKRIFLTAGLLMLFTVNLLFAGPKDRLTVTSGVVMPAGSFDNTFSVTAAWYFSPLKSDLDGRGYVSWWSADRKSGDESVTLNNYTFGFDVIKRGVVGFKNLYAGAGISYHLQLLSNSLEFKPDLNETRIGVSPLVGIYLPAKFAQLYVESRYTFIGGERNFVQLSAGVAISL